MQVTQKSDIFKGNYADANSDVVDWSEVKADAVAGNAEPMVAFVRLYDGDVTDVVFYVAE